MLPAAYVLAPIGSRANGCVASCSADAPFDVQETGGGSCLRSILLLLVRGHSSTPTTSEGSMYAGSDSRTPRSARSWSNGNALHPPLKG
eukprot:6877013-Prymnesium_polylepis.1